MNDVKTPHAIETNAEDGKRLRCAFSSADGIFTHVVELIEGDAVTMVLSSVESHDETPWPASPPWQELHVHQLANGSPALMLVGRAGSSHWSMSVTIDGDSLLFDVACRLRESPVFLGGTYRLSSAERLVSISPVPIEEIAPLAIKEADEQIIIDSTDVGQAPATVRWAYRIAQA